MGMYENFLDILKVLRNDETLLRLLYYQPEDAVNNIPDPLSDSLPDILKMDSKTRNEIRNNHIVKSSKADDLEDNPICRIYIYAGKRIPERDRNNSYLMAEQQMEINIIVHNDFENEDIRMERILDRLNYLLCLNRITGIGKMDYEDGRPILNAPKNYVGYQVIYKFGSTKK